MLEFLMMMSVIAMIFCAATVFVALIAGMLMKAFRTFSKPKTIS